MDTKTADADAAISADAVPHQRSPSSSPGGRARRCRSKRDPSDTATHAGRPSINIQWSVRGGAFGKGWGAGAAAAVPVVTSQQMQDASAAAADTEAATSASGEKRGEAIGDSKTNENAAAVDEHA